MAQERAKDDRERDGALDESRVSLHDVTRLFQALDITVPHPISIQETPETYEFEDEVENNWLYAAFQGFLRLQEKLNVEGKRCSYFVSTGTGSGLDGIGAYYIFKPDRVHLTDVNKRVIPYALDNFRRNTPANICSASGSVADLLLYLMIHGEEADIIYGNLPNIPAQQVEMEGSRATATFALKNGLEDCPENFSRHLLAMQRKFLLQARDCLTHGGSTVSAIGARMPFEHIAALFEHCGLRLEELVTMLKVQTQPQDVIAGYAQAEEQGVDFSFYDLEITPVAPGYVHAAGCADLQSRLKTSEISAKKALERHSQGAPIGHIVSISRGVK